MAVVTTGIKYNKLTSRSDTADKLTSAVDISIQDADGTNTGTPVSFDGSDDTTAKLPSTIKATLTGNASSATEFSAAQSVTLTGDITGTTSSKAGWSVATTLKNSGVTAGTYKSVTVDAKGVVTDGTNPTTLNGYGITDANIENGVITLGSNTITPLTNDQLVEAYPLDIRTLSALENNQPLLEKQLDVSSANTYLKIKFYTHRSTSDDLTMDTLIDFTKTDFNIYSNVTQEIGGLFDGFTNDQITTLLDNTITGAIVELKCVDIDDNNTMKFYSTVGNSISGCSISDYSTWSYVTDEATNSGTSVNNSSYWNVINWNWMDVHTFSDYIIKLNYCSDVNNNSTNFSDLNGAVYGSTDDPELRITITEDYKVYLSYIPIPMVH